MLDSQLRTEIDDKSTNAIENDVQCESKILKASNSEIAELKQSIESEGGVVYHSKKVSKICTARYRVLVIGTLPMLGSDTLLKEIYRKINMATLRDLFKNIYGSRGLNWYFERDIGRNLMNDISNLEDKKLGPLSALNADDLTLRQQGFVNDLFAVSSIQKNPEIFMHAFNYESLPFIIKNRTFDF
ncbi:hypothetical protein FGO68_gene12802 [Halteria grandinella]|uniref:Uncharacterized protein n=1 Tax=Halteria grandinella TaxID=5974 RepID=A0A8J8T873_HALGN|nr:hypothetical protein FGO68_gene12802 [Halteria grandinella]